MRTPWLRVDARIGEDPQIAKLPSDSARWAGILCLGKAKAERPHGRFKSQAHLEAAIGRYGRHVPQMIVAGLLQIDSDSSISVRSWKEWQSDLDLSTHRVAKLRALRRGETA